MLQQEEEGSTFPPAEAEQAPFSLAGLPPGVPRLPSSCFDHGMSRKFLKAKKYRLFYGISRKRPTGYPVADLRVFQL